MHCRAAWTKTSGGLVLFIPDHRLPQLHLVSLGIHDPRELPVFMRFGAANNFYSVRTELRDHLAEIVNPVVNHERGVAGAEPLAFLFGDVPYGEPFVVGFVILPFQNSAAKALQLHAQVFLIPSHKSGPVVAALEEYTANSRNSRHRLPPFTWFADALSGSGSRATLLAPSPLRTRRKSCPRLKHLKRLLKGSGS